MSRGPSTSKIKFLSIARDLREHPHTNQADIAVRHRVSQGTVSKVNRTGNWGNWLAGKQATHTIQQNAIKRAASATKSYMIQEDGHLKQVKVQEARLARELKRSQQVMSREEVESEFRSIHSRIDILSATYRTLARKPLFRFLYGRQIARAIHDSEVQAR